jgi:ABC-type transport system involved in cytochrome bd biosynthesis fused ATPase/permease subunit
VLVLDEPTAHLDVPTAERLIDDVLDGDRRPHRAADHAPPEGLDRMDDVVRLSG